MSQENPTPDLPDAGWYPDPKQPKTKRYWDGQAWTDQRLPIAEKRSPGGPEAAPGWALVVGYLGAFLFPLVGLIVGVWLFVRRAIGHGIAMVGISLLIGVGTYLITVDEDDNGPRHRSELSVEEQTERALERKTQRARQRPGGILKEIARQTRGADGAGGD